MEVFPYKDTNKFLQIDLHDGLFYPCPPSPLPVPGIAGHIGTGRLSWGPGYVHNDNGGDILADNARLISKEHEVAHVIVAHSNIPPIPLGINIFIPLLILASSNTSIYACHSVLAKDGPVAVAKGRDLGTNLACNDPFSLPTCEVRTGGTVLLGFTQSDLEQGDKDLIEAILEDAVMSLLTSFIPLPQSVKRQFGMFYHRLIKKIPGFEAVGGGVYRATNGQYASIPQEVADILIPAAASTIKDISEYLTGD
jgi:hypothetical protein